MNLCPPLLLVANPHPPFEAQNHLNERLPDGRRIMSFAIVGSLQHFDFANSVLSSLTKTYTSNDQKL